MAQNTHSMGACRLYYGRIFHPYYGQGTSTMGEVHLYYGSIHLYYGSIPPLLWLNTTSTMAQYHLYYGPIDPYYGSIEPYYGSFSPTLWLLTPDFAIQSPSPHPSPGYTETKSAVPRKRISDNNPTRETYKQAHPATHRDSGSLRQSPSDIAARAQVSDGGAQDARHARHTKMERDNR